MLNMEQLEAMAKEAGFTNVGPLDAATIELKDEVRAMCNANAWAEAETLARTTEFLELATLPEFQDEFVEQLNFEDEDED